MTSPRSPVSTSPRLLVLGGLHASAVAVLAAGVSYGVNAGLLIVRPAAVGLGAFAIAALLGALLGATPPGQAEPRVHGALALGIVACLLAVGFLFGPVSLVVALGVPLTAAVVAPRLGWTWAAGIVMLGTVGAATLAGLTFYDVIPAAPAFLDASFRAHPVTHLLHVGATLTGGGIALGVMTPAAAPEIEALTVRSGSFTRDELTSLRPDQYSPKEMAAARNAIGDKSIPPPSAPEVDATLEMQKLESLGVLAGGIAHDFNNLLMGVLGNTSIALMEVSEGHEAHVPLREIEVAAKRARDLVGQLLAYAGKGNVTIAPIDLNALVSEMGDLLNTAIHKRAILKYGFCEQVPLIVADPSQVRQVVMNLITNGADAMKSRDGSQVFREGGEVTLSTQIRYVPKAELEDTLLGLDCEPGTFVELKVRDQGRGMDAETLGRIFDPFYTTKRSGRGLGLAAVLGIVRRYGGTMDVESKVGEGTTFRVLFPYAEQLDEDEDLPTEHTSTAKGWVSMASGAILVIDDDPVVLRVTTRMVARLKFEVLEAESGEASLEIFRQHGPKRVLAVILDMTMPGMNGTETLMALREIDPDVRVILTSGYSEDELPSGKQATHFLQKPYSLKQLTKILDVVLDS